MERYKVVEQFDERHPEAASLQAQRVECIAALTAGIAHDLMSVLASVSMSLELLVPTLTPADAWLADALSEGVQRGKEGVRQIYWLASARAGEPLFYDPLHLVKDARKLMAQAFPRIAVSADYPPEVGLVWGEPMLLRQLLIGLCVDACIHVPPGSTLTLRASRLVPASADGGAPRARFEIESGREDGASSSEFETGEWRERPAMAGLLSAFAAQGGKVERERSGAPGFRARIEMPIAAPPEEAE